MAETDHIDVSFNCDRCGSQLLWKDDLRDDETVTCPNCGKEGPTLGQLKEAAMQASTKAIDDVMGQPLDWKPE